MTRHRKDRIWHQSNQPARGVNQQTNYRKQHTHSRIHTHTHKHIHISRAISSQLLPIASNRTVDADNFQTRQIAKQQPFRLNLMPAATIFRRFHRNLIQIKSNFHQTALHAMAMATAMVTANGWRLTVTAKAKMQNARPFHFSFLWKSSQLSPSASGFDSI